MSNTLEKIKKLVVSGAVRISEHGYDELANDDLTAREIVGGLGSAIPIEHYPHYPKGASVLVLQADKNGQPVHVVWGIPRRHERPAVLVTAYRPDPERWNKNYTERKR
ncbi:MAG: DUF4258 domain-containing protein [Gammaproteobacteria bacterium]|nr:DUF4258 domain-containing protein [Gammaproteobacteria bacterium]